MSEESGIVGFLDSVYAGILEKMDITTDQLSKDPFDFEKSSLEQKMAYCSGFMSARIVVCGLTGESLEAAFRKMFGMEDK